MNNIVRSAKTIKATSDAAKASIEVVDMLVERASRLKLLFSGAVSMPSEAEKAVEEILEEIVKSVDALDQAAREFLVAVENPVTFLEDSDKAHEMSSSRLPRLVEDKRGHCHRISELDWKYLNGWIDKFFDGEVKKTDEARQVLNELSDADNSLFDALKVAAEKMRDTSRAAYRLLLSGKGDEAQTVLRSAGLDFLDMRDTFNDASARMAELKSDFVKTRSAHRRLSTEATVNSEN